MRTFTTFDLGNDRKAQPFAIQPPWRDCASAAGPLAEMRERKASNTSAAAATALNATKAGA
ncbi:hypothetical protein [Achromobacter xylosoxidans]|uniref:hypothetical protein n=1 Tax=Alcaligenes xylosoxydans xylosoxydans TaxID=85698 RepID=UPI0030CA2909